MIVDTSLGESLEAVLRPVTVRSPIVMSILRLEADGL